MRTIKFAASAATLLIATGVAFADARFAPANAWDGDEYATSEMGAGDWSKAEAALMNSGVSQQDEVFAKLNLAFVYSSTGRKDMAAALYNEILASRENPYALTVSGQPRRVKTIAKVALARLGEDQ